MPGVRKKERIKILSVEFDKRNWFNERHDRNVPQLLVLNQKDTTLNKNSHGNRGQSKNMWLNDLWKDTKNIHALSHTIFQEAKLRGKK